MKRSLNIPTLALVISFCFLLPWISIAQKPLKVGIIKYKTREKLAQTYQPLMEYLGQQLGREVTLTILPDSESGYEAEDLAFLLDHNEFDLGIFTVFPYLGARADFPNLAVFASHEVDGSEHFYGNILVRKDSEIDNLMDLQGKRFLFVKPTSTSGFKYPNGIFKEHSIDIDYGFFNYDFSGDHIASIEQLYAGEVDGIAVDESRIAKATDVDPDAFKVLERYEVPYHAYVFAPGLSEDMKDQIKTLMFKAHQNPKARHILNNPLGIEKWVAQNDDYYNIIRRYLRIVREKPYVQWDFELSESAKSAFQQNDLLIGLTNRTEKLMVQSGRFSDQPNEFHRLVPKIKLSLVDDTYHYQLMLDGAYLGENDVSKKNMMNSLPELLVEDLLVSQVMEDNLLFNGRDWFITYGHNDGINEQDYQFTVSTTSGASITIDGNEIKKMDDLNTFFAARNDFEKGAAVQVTYLRKFEGPVVADNTQGGGTWNIFSSHFWEDAHFWDKLGLIAGIVMAILSAVFGRYLAQRKKRRFKNILYQTNELVKEYLEGHYKLENKLIEQKDFIGKCFEEGNINEPQFLMLNQRIDDLHDIVERHQNNNLTLNQEQSEAIREIIKDGKITEREFAKIMTILRRGSKAVKPQAN